MTWGIGMVSFGILGLIVLVVGIAAALATDYVKRRWPYPDDFKAHIKILGTWESQSRVDFKNMMVSTVQGGGLQIQDEDGDFDIPKECGISPCVRVYNSVDNKTRAQFEGSTRTWPVVFYVEMLQ